MNTGSSKLYYYLLIVGFISGTCNANPGNGGLGVTMLDFLLVLLFLIFIIFLLLLIFFSIKLSLILFFKHVDKQVALASYKKSIKNSFRFSCWISSSLVLIFITSLGFTTLDFLWLWLILTFTIYLLLLIFFSIKLSIKRPLNHVDKQIALVNYKKNIKSSFRLSCWISSILVLIFMAFFYRDYF